MEDARKYFQNLKDHIVPTSLSSFKIELKTWSTVYHELFQSNSSSSVVSSSGTNSSPDSASIVSFLFSSANKAEPTQESEEASRMRTRPWYYDTPTYALPNLRRRELSIYPDDDPLHTVPSLSDQESKSILSSPTYQSIVYYKRNVTESILFLTGSLHALIDVWIEDVEQPIRKLLKRNK